MGMNNELKLIGILSRLVSTVERCDLNGTKTSDSFVFKEAKEILEEVERDHIQLMRELRRLYEAKDEAARQRLLALLEEMMAEDEQAETKAREPLMLEVPTLMRRLGNQIHPDGEGDNEEDQEGVRES
jgi:hypothetical protein